MKNNTWIAVLVMIGILLSLPFSAMAEADAGGIEITINGVPVEEVIGAASEIFADVVEENTSQAIDGLNAVFDEFAKGFSEGLGEMEGLVDGLINDSWGLSFPELGMEEEIRRSSYDNALDLYKAQLSGETDKSLRIAMDTQEGCGNSIVYVYDEGPLTETVLEAMENDTLGIGFASFGPGNYRSLHRIHAVLYLTPSDEPFAICNMTDLRDEQKLEAYTDYVIEHAVKIEDPEFKDGGPLMTIIIWGPDENADWLTLVTQEEPMLLE